ncbi:hypothetical protein SZ64_15055 [Erythrobacter sp. SG61-1L]|nr:hypothetical protein SZ64_15055 [Erythrobacter sp. SG61-1L]
MGRSVRPLGQKGILRHQSSRYFFGSDKCEYQLLGYRIFACQGALDGHKRGQTDWPCLVYGGENSVTQRSEMREPRARITYQH